MTFCKTLLAGTTVFAMAGVAQADLRICNETDAKQGVSIGYKSGDNRGSEGWWNLPKGGCATVVQGDLKQRYYYYRAEINGGEFEGEGYMFCTSTSEYTIIGDTDCGARGYDREDFREVDTGATATDFTISLGY